MIDFSKYTLPNIRHHVSPNLYIPRAELTVDLSYYPPLYIELQWEQIFANGKPPQILDIGCGLGKFMLNYSYTEGVGNVLGLEVRKRVCEWVQDIIHAEQVGNAGILWYSVVNGLPFIASNSIEKIFYFFPDPWYKKRHVKRRAFTVDFLAECHRMLAPNGILFLQTDVPEVDAYQQEVLQEFGGFSYHPAGEEEWRNHYQLPKTNQEEICLRNGIPYTRLVCVKK